MINLNNLGFENGFANLMSSWVDGKLTSYNGFDIAINETIVTIGQGDDLRIYNFRFLNDQYGMILRFKTKGDDDLELLNIIFVKLRRRMKRRCNLVYLDAALLGNDTLYKMVDPRDIMPFLFEQGSPHIQVLESLLARNSRGYIGVLRLFDYLNNADQYELVVTYPDGESDALVVNPVAPYKNMSKELINQLIANALLVDGLNLLKLEDSEVSDA